MWLCYVKGRFDGSRISGHALELCAGCVDVHMGACEDGHAGKARKMARSPTMSVNATIVGGVAVMDATVVGGLCGRVCRA